MQNPKYALKSCYTDEWMNPEPTKNSIKSSRTQYTCYMTFTYWNLLHRTITRGFAWFLLTVALPVYTGPQRPLQCRRMRTGFVWVWTTPIWSSCFDSASRRENTWAFHPTLIAGPLFCEDISHKNLMSWWVTVAAHVAACFAAFVLPSGKNRINAPLMSTGKPPKPWSTEMVTAS